MTWLTINCGPVLNSDYFTPSSNGRHCQSLLERAGCGQIEEILFFRVGSWTVNLAYLFLVSFCFLMSTEHVTK